MKMICLECGKEHKNKRFCSRSCARKYTWKKENSPYKTKEYSEKISKMRKEWYKTNEHPKGMLGKKQSEKTKKSSSERCKKRVGNKHPNWIGGTQSYWNKIARKVMEDEPDVCFLNKNCNGKIVVHHKDKDITNNNKNNLVKVCWYHHRVIFHKEQLKKMEKARWEMKL